MQSLKYIKKGVHEMINYEERAKAREEVARKQAIIEGRAEGRESGLIEVAVNALKKQALKGKTFNEDKAVNFLVDNLDLEIDIAKKAFAKFVEK